MTATFSDTAAPPRIAAIDWARGFAVYLMALYHLAWDLNNAGFTDWPLFTHPFWLAARAVIVSAFLFLAGLSLALADARGRIGIKAYWVRIATVSVGALLVTAGTWIMFPDHFVFFGVLHCIAVSCVILLPFLRLPVWVILLSGIAAISAPQFLAAPLFDSPWLSWIGLVTRTPESVDFVPLFPFAGVILLGMAFGRQKNTSPAGAFTVWQPSGAISRLTCWLGRHSLIVYILHQPLLVAFVWLAAQLIR